MTSNYIQTDRSNFSIAFLSGLLYLISFGVNAETVESTEYRYYEISPRSAYEIKPELMRRSPIRERGGSFNGHTDWLVNWSFSSTSGAYGCQLNSYQTTVHVIHTLPKLSSYVTDKRTIEVFNTFNEALTQHEVNHGNNGLAAAREIDKAFSEIQPQQNCRNLERMINDIGNSIVQKYIYADREYDRTTQNGFTEGAVIY